MLKFQKREVSGFEGFLASSMNTLDLFGQVPIFRILKRTKFTTSIGCVFTLSMLSICLVYLVINLGEIQQRKNPSVVVNDIQQSNSQPVMLFKHNFTFAITVANIQYSSLKTLNSTFTLKVQNCHRSRRYNEADGKLNVTQSCIDYALEPCDREKHFVTPSQKNFFQNFTLNYIYCLNSQQWDARPPVIQGTVVADDFQYMTVQLSPCKNTTESQQCAPQDTINKQLNYGYYAVYMSDFLVQMDTSGRPFEEITTVSFTSFSINNSKQLLQFIRHTSSLTDTGFILKELTIDTALVQATIRETQDFYNSQFIVLHSFGLDFRSTEYRRQYQKVQEILGIVGGLWQVLYFSFGLFMKPLVQRMMNLEMANKLFRFDSNEQETQSFQTKLRDEDNQFAPENLQLSQNRSVRLSSEGLIPQRKFSMFRKRLQPDINSQEQIKTFLKQKKRDLTLGFKQLILIFCGCRKKEKQQLDYATKKIMNKLDVSYIIQKLFEIDKLKKVLLTTDQQKLFNYLPKPVIPDILFEKENEDKIKQLEVIPQYQYILEEEKSEFMRLIAAHQAFIEIKKLNHPNQIENKLVGLIDNDILQLFQNIDSLQQGVKTRRSPYKHQQCNEIPICTDLDDHINSVPILKIQRMRESNQ